MEPSGININAGLFRYCPTFGKLTLVILVKKYWFGLEKQFDLFMIYVSISWKYYPMSMVYLDWNYLYDKLVT